MGWKVKQWRGEQLRAIVGEQALEAARLTREQAVDAARLTREQAVDAARATHEQAARHAARILAAAERDARRRRRTGRRATRAAEADLVRLERLGDDLLARVQEHRARLRAEAAEAALGVRIDSGVEAAPQTPPEPGATRRPPRLTRGRRSRLRASPLAELLRSTQHQAPAGR